MGSPAEVMQALRDKASVYQTRGRSPKGLPLPPTRLRMGGTHFRDDAAFVAGACRDAARLVRQAGLTDDSAVLDIGCGAGRLAIGILEEVGGTSEYVGLDVNPYLVAWADRHLTRVDRRIRFEHVDVANERYNRNGQLTVKARAMPVDDDHFDIAYAYSVFSHMRSEDVRQYLQESRRVLRSNGVFVFTAFVEDDVADEEENPANYGPTQWFGPLHCVRYARDYFLNMIDAAALTVLRAEHGTETDGQSLYIVGPVHMTARGAVG